jgi:hypothetical protein
MDRDTIDLEQAELDDLLSRWWSWCSDDRIARGYPTTAAGTRDYRTSRQWDDWNESLDGDVENTILAAVDACIDTLPVVHKTAIGICARNLVSGVACWRSVRLPEDDLARALVVAEARSRLLAELRARGLV